MGFFRLISHPDFCEREKEKSQHKEFFRVVSHSDFCVFFVFEFFSSTRNLQRCIGLEIVTSYWMFLSTSNRAFFVLKRKMGKIKETFSSNTRSLNAVNLEHIIRLLMKDSIIFKSPNETNNIKADRIASGWELNIFQVVKKNFHCL
jgi:hypothetical protein